MSLSPTPWRHTRVAFYNSLVCPICILTPIAPGELPSLELGRVTSPQYVPGVSWQPPGKPGGQTHLSLPFPRPRAQAATSDIGVWLVEERERWRPKVWVWTSLLLLSSDVTLAHFKLGLLGSEVRVLGNSSPRSAHVSVHPASWGTDCLCSGLSFQRCLYSKKPWKVHAPEKTTWLPQAQGSSVVAEFTLGALFAMSCGSCCSEELAQMLALWLGLLICRKPPFVMDPGVSCLLPASVKLVG